MNETKVINRVIKFVKKELQNSEGGHDWFHIERVYKNALLISKTEKVDLFVVSLGALLHDIADAKFHHGDETIGPKIAKDFLPSNVAHAPCTIKPEKIQNPASVPNGVKYKNIINRMKSLLERERKNLRRARAAYEREVQDRSELEYFLRRCVNDVRNEISRRRGELVEYSRTQLRSDDHNLTNAHSIDSNPQKDEESTKEFSCADRERVMELLLSQERVISLLYSKTFPIKESIPVANSTGQAATRFPSVQTN